MIYFSLKCCIFQEFINAFYSVVVYCMSASPSFTKHSIKENSFQLMRLFLFLVLEMPQQDIAVEFLNCRNNSKQ